MLSVSETARKLSIPATTVKWYLERYAAFLSPSKGKGRKRVTPEDLALLQDIHKLSQEHSSDEVEKMLELSVGENSITMYRSDALTTALDVVSSRLKDSLEESIRQALAPEETLEKVADKAISKLLENIGTNTRLELWIDKQLVKAEVKSLTEAKMLAKRLYKAVIRRWKDSQK